MPTSITPLLAERLDIPEDQAESLLETMVQELQQRAETDGVQLSGLGTFREEQGTLTFEPGPSLRRRVNRQFEGLSAEPLAPASDADEGPSSPGGSLPGPTDTPDSTEPEPPPFLQSPPGPDETEEASGPPDPEDQAPTPAQDRPAAPSHSRGDRSPDSFTVISLVLLVLFLLGAGWFVLDRTNLWGPSSTASSPTTTQSPTDTADQPPASDAQDATASGTTDQDTSSAAPDPEAPAQDWTIIVASRTTRSAAQEVADAYTSRFDSVAVVAGTVDNTTWYRVAIGQYATEADAEQALAARSDALPSDAWTHRLR